MINNVSDFGTKNMFLESCFALNLDFSKDLTVDVITDAYNKLAYQHLELIKNNKIPTFEMKDKHRAKEYLINSLKPKHK